MEYRVEGSDIVVFERDLDLEETLDCGQAFRWEKISSKPTVFHGYYLNKELFVSGENGSFKFHNTTKEDFENIWVEYFDFNTDYSKLKSDFSKDETLKKACEFAPGIRLLKQDKWESLCSFIISQNNNIPRIKVIIGRLCEKYGGFPTAEDLSVETVESLGYLRAGFRAKYILDAAKKVSSGEIDLEKISTMPIEKARAELRKIKGVGPKVAECVLLFGMYRTDAFPVDVWIKRVMARFYPDGIPEFVKGSEGIAQQFLFHYVRNLDKSEFEG